MQVKPVTVTGTQIIDATVAVNLEQGYDRASFARIAERAGISSHGRSPEMVPVPCSAGNVGSERAVLTSRPVARKVVPCGFWPLADS